MCLIAKHTRDLTRRTSNEAQRYVNRRVSALDPLVDVSPDGRHHPRDGKGRNLKPRCCTHPGRLAVRNAGARRTAIRVRHHPPRVAPWIGHPVIHMKGAGVGAQVAKAPSGAFFFVWTLIALGVTALFSVILSARGLWSPQWGQSR